MSENFKTPVVVGSFVILDFADAPCTRHIAEVDEIHGSEVIAHYICENTPDSPVISALSECTDISDFGVKLKFEQKGQLVRGEVRGSSKAQYPDGKRRDWQPERVELHRVKERGEKV